MLKEYSAAGFLSFINDLRLHEINPSFSISPKTGDGMLYFYIGKSQFDVIFADIYRDNDRKYCDRVSIEDSSIEKILMKLVDLKGLAEPGERAEYYSYLSEKLGKRERCKTTNPKAKVPHCGFRSPGKWGVALNLTNNEKDKEYRSLCIWSE